MDVRSPDILRSSPHPAGKLSCHSAPACHCRYRQRSGCRNGSGTRRRCHPHTLPPYHCPGLPPSHRDCLRLRPTASHSPAGADFGTRFPLFSDSLVPRLRFPLSSPRRNRKSPSVSEYFLSFLLPESLTVIPFLHLLIFPLRPVPAPHRHLSHSYLLYFSLPFLPLSDILGDCL